MMHRSRGLFTIVLLGTVLLGAACAARRPATLASTTAGRNVALVVVTWNVQEGRGDVLGFIEDLAGGRLTGRPVQDFVIFLQETIEGGEHDVMGIAGDLGLSAHFVPVRQTDRGLSGNAILATRPLLSTHAIDLPRVRRQRNAAAATIEIAGTHLFAVSAHLENRAGWLRALLFSDRGRARQAEALLRSLPAGPGIVGGDLNTWLGAGEPARRVLLTRFEDTPTVPLGPTFHGRLVLDHLFFDLPEAWEATHQVVRSRYGSDHHPVVGVLFHKTPRPGTLIAAEALD
jgi:endonuclease/exonuclease/phosphatase family metal-dependent hydrolase